MRAALSRGADDGRAQRSRAVKVSVILTALAYSNALERCLQRIRAQCDELGAELVLVVNDRQEAMAPSVRMRLDAIVDTLLFEPTPGKSSALNTAIKACRGDVIAFSDDDALPASDWLRQLVEPLMAEDRAPRLVGCGGPVFPVYPNGGPPRWYRQIIARTRSSFLGPHQFLGAHERDYAPKGGSPAPFGANCAYLRSALIEHPYPLELGPNRVTGIRGGEDTVVALQLIRSGCRLRYVPCARVYHPVDPERMRLEYVERGHYLQGIEWVRICRLAGLPMPMRSELRRRMQRLHGNALTRCVWNRDRRIRRRLRQKFVQGVLDELPD